MDPVTRQLTQARHPLSPLGKAALAALIINGCASILPLCIHLFFDDGRLIVPLLVIAVLVLGCAALVARGVRWAPLLGGLVALATAALDSAQPDSSFTLLHPGTDPAHFATLLVLLTSALAALLAGLATRAGAAARLAPHRP